jgi:hypothetical protein
MRTYLTQYFSPALGVAESTLLRQPRQQMGAITITPMWLPWIFGIITIVSSENSVEKTRHEGVLPD